MSKPVIADIAADVRQMGEGDFYDDLPQSAGLKCWAPNSLALRHWVEGWERAAVVAFCEREAMKDQWMVEQFKRYLHVS